MPCNYKEYPENWKWLSKQIIKDANNKCELCYAPNHQFVVRNRNTGSYPWGATWCLDEHNVGLKVIRIILTVHHIDSDKKNNTKQNLIALCQWCHLRLDLQKHMKNRRAARKSTKEANLQLTTAKWMPYRLA